jgi:hypothetical protein
MLFGLPFFSSFVTARLLPFGSISFNSFHPVYQVSGRVLAAVTVEKQFFMLYPSKICIICLAFHLISAGNSDQKQTGGN